MNAGQSEGTEAEAGLRQDFHIQSERLLGAQFPGRRWESARLPGRHHGGWCSGKGEPFFMIRFCSLWVITMVTKVFFKLLGRAHVQASRGLFLEGLTVLQC